MNDQPYRSDDSLPVRRSQVPPVVTPPPVDPVDDYDVGGTAQNKKITLRLIGRALRRHLWQALLLWLVVSAGLMALAYYKIKPTYDAVAQIQVELGDIIFTQRNGAQIDFQQVMEMQANRVTNPVVISNALTTHPEVLQFPMLQNSDAPEIEVKRAVRAQVIPKTPFIQIDMSSNTPNEAAIIVNAVFDAFLQYAETTYDASTQKKINQFKEMEKEQQEEVNRQRKIVDDFQKRIGLADEKALKDRNTTSIEAYKRLSEELTSVKIRRITTQAKLDQLRNDKVGPIQEIDGEQLDTLLTEAFYAEPQVEQLQREIEKADAKFKDVKRVTRNQGDPAYLHAKNRLDELEGRKNELWNKLKSRLRRKILAGPADMNADRLIRDAEAELAAMSTQETTLNAMLENVRIENKQADNEAFQLECARRDLQRAEAIFDKIRENLEQATFDAKSPQVKVSESYRAKPATRPSHERRLQAVIAAPILTAVLVFSLLIMLEMRGGRVSDPDELSSRMNLQVIGVVPPLPQIRVSPGGPGSGSEADLPAPTADLKAQRQLDEFVQSLDHLRVALCARRDPWGRDRHCILITSACGSEGKTTLAAQLAERCVNAGMMTLLIDADLRNPTLSRMLDATEQLGLINVLRGESIAEDAIMVIGDAGGFHLLPAGTPRVDPSRLLQSDRLGKLLAQARESFDMIIVDAPPVLPVPDALTIGRWTDGAVLAVRHDTSRFPLVERAHRRLTHVGVPIIGAVVNGVRSMEAGYGGYYTYGYGSYGSVSSASVEE